MRPSSSLKYIKYNKLDIVYRERLALTNDVNILILNGDHERRSAERVDTINVEEGRPPFNKLLLLLINNNNNHTISNNIIIINQS